MSGSASPKNTQFPAFPSAWITLRSFLLRHAANVPGFVSSFAWHPRSLALPLPAAFALPDGHLPSPGQSPARVVTQALISVSSAACVPGQAPSALLIAASAFACALLRQFGSTAVVFALALE